MTIKVMCRVRPPLESDIGEQIVQVDNNKIFMSYNKQQQTFTFDQAFPPTAQQNEVFAATISVLDQTLQGMNGTIFSYGATCAGKTYSISGPDFDSEYRGIIPRSLEYIFSQIETLENENRKYRISISFLEIYLERVRDLLAPTSSLIKQNLQVFEGEIAVPDATEIQVDNLQEVMEILHQANQFKVMAPNKINRQSSRSHCILQVNIMSRDLTTNRYRLSKLFLADLAGSEKIMKTESEGLRLDEAKQINKSLLALGKVVFALTQNQSYIPYRDSKLTRLLKCSLGGNSNTLLLVHISPNDDSLTESLSTLLFASRARNVKNTVHLNEFMDNDGIYLQKAVQVLLRDREIIRSLATQQQLPPKVLDGYLKKSNDNEYISQILDSKQIITLKSPQNGLTATQQFLDNECATPSIILDSVLSYDENLQPRQHYTSDNIINGQQQSIKPEDLLQLKQDQAMLYELTGKPQAVYYDVHDICSKPEDSCQTIFQIIQLRNMLVFKDKITNFDVEITNSNGLTPLNYAFLIGNIEAGEIMIRHGADVMLRDRNGNLPLHILLDNLCNLRTIEQQNMSLILISLIADEMQNIYDIVDSRNRLPIQILIQAQNVLQDFKVQVFNILLSKKFDIFMDNQQIKSDQWYAVMDCVYNSDERCLVALLQFTIENLYNNSVNNLEILGIFRAFHLSIKLVNHELVAAFIHFDAIKNNLVNCQFMNQSAIELAFMIQNYAAFEYLLKKGAVISQTLLDKLFNNNSIAYIEVALPFCDASLNFNQPMAAAVSFGSVQLFQLITQKESFQLDQKIASMCLKVYGENSDFYKLVKCFIKDDSDLLPQFEEWITRNTDLAFKLLPEQFRNQQELLEQKLEKANVFLIEYLYKREIPLQLSKHIMLQLCSNSLAQLTVVLKKQPLTRLFTVAKLQRKVDWIRFLSDFCQ